MPLGFVVGSKVAHSLMGLLSLMLLCLPESLRFSQAAHSPRSAVNDLCLNCRCISWLCNYASGVSSHPQCLHKGHLTQVSRNISVIPQLPVSPGQAGMEIRGPELLFREFQS